MIHKFHYKKNIHNFSHKIEVMEGDIVKTENDGDKLYRVSCIHDSDLKVFDFGCCVIIAQNAEVPNGYNSYPIRGLVFVERKFWDPDHF